MTHYKFHTRKKETKGYFGFVMLLAIAFTSMIVLGFTTEEKKIPVSLTLKEWSKHNNGLNAISGYLRQQNLPAKDVSYIQDSIITPFQLELARQINLQLADTTKKK